MLAKRIIPCLDIKDGRVVKGVHFVNLRDAGDPVEQARAYDRMGADELVFLDIIASPAGQQTVAEMVRRVADEVFLPFTVGGGIRSADDMRLILLAGADKVSVNTAAVLNPEILTAGAERFGSQCMVLAIDARLTPAGRWEVVYPRRQASHRHRRHRVGAARRGAGRRRDLADQHGYRWRLAGVRYTPHPGSRRGGQRSDYRQRRRRYARAFR